MVSLSAWGPLVLAVFVTSSGTGGVSLDDRLLGRSAAGLGPLGFSLYFGSDFGNLLLLLLLVLSLVALTSLGPVQNPVQISIEDD